MTKREELVALANEFDDIAVDADGKCYWCDVANAQTHLRAQLHRFAAQASAAPPEREADRTTLNSIPEDGFNCIFLYENGREVGCLNGPQNDPDVIARAEHWCRLSSRDDGEAGYIDDVERSFDETPLSDSLKPTPSTVPADVLAMKEVLEPFASYQMHVVGFNGAVSEDDLKDCTWVAGFTGPQPTFKHFDDARAAISRLDVPGKTAKKPAPMLSRDWKTVEEQIATAHGDELLSLFRDYLVMNSRPGNDLAPLYIARIDELLSAPAAEQGVAVKVKPLVWRDHRPDSFPEPAWSAETPFGFYHIEEVSASDSPAYVVRLHAHHFIADKDGLDAAKAAAQADYENRIKSALETEAQGAAVSVEELAQDLYLKRFRMTSTDLAHALLDKYSIRSAMMTEGK